MTQITSPRSTGLRALNALDVADAAVELLACCASRRWANAVAEGRPYRDGEQLLNTSDAAFAALTEEDIDEAIAAHPRIGERAAGESRESQWSRREQATAATTDGATQAALRVANQTYEQQFSRVFLICASGLSARDVLAAIGARLENSAEQERKVVREELRKITRLRLRELIA